jgi:hypothetical protein
MSILQDPVRAAADALASMRAAVTDGDLEGMVVLGLDRTWQLCGVGVNGRHRALSFVKVWELHALAQELAAHALVVALFPTGAARAPSRHEVDAFVALRDRARRAGVVLLDCIVVRAGQSWSLAALLERVGAQSRPKESDL